MTIPHSARFLSRGGKHQKLRDKHGRWCNMSTYSVAEEAESKIVVGMDCVYIYQNAPIPYTKLLEEPKFSFKFQNGYSLTGKKLL